MPANSCNNQKLLELRIAYIQRKLNKSSNGFDF